LSKRISGCHEWVMVKDMKIDDIIKGVTIPRFSDLKIVSIENLGRQRMVDLQTSTKTYIANGIVSHNSTAISGYIYHKTITTPGFTSALIGYNSELTSELLDKIKTFYRTTPVEIRPVIQYNSKYEISFPKMNSKILVLPSTDTVGRGYTLNAVLLTELAFWDKAEEKMNALENSVPISGLIIVESTPNGIGNMFHKMWVSDNAYVKKEYGWWWDYSEDDIELIKKRINDPRRFAQEYELEFLSSGRNVFEVSLIKKMREGALSVGDTYVDKTGVSRTVEEHDFLRMYQPPVSDGIYCMGSDIAEGVEGGDYSTAIIWNRKTGEEVAFFRGHVPPDIFATKLDKWGRLYNNALMVVEVNNHGLTTITKLKEKAYPTMYFRLDKVDSISQSMTDRLGWKTTKSTKLFMIDDFNQAVREGALTIHSRETMDEMASFVYSNSGEMRVPHGYHDDCLMGSAIGFQGFKMLYHKELEQINYNDHLPTNFSY
jgi:hypothetical protein